MIIADQLRPIRTAVLAGRFAEALDAIATLPMEVRTSADALLFRSMALWRTGDYLESAALAREASRAFAAVGDSDGVMRSENVAAAADFALGNLGDARLGFVRALNLADTLRDHLLIARCANNLGNVAYYLKDYPRALSSYRLAEANFENAHWSKGLAEVWLNRSIVLREMQELHESMGAGDRAVDHADADDDKRLLGQALATRGETRAHLGDHQAAAIEAHRAHELAVAEGNPLDAGDALRVRSVVERLRGESAQAVRFGEEAAGIVRPLGHSWTIAEVERDLGEAYAAAHQRTKAIKGFETALAGMERMGATARIEELRDRITQLS